jgi:hypothetical protein
MTNPVVLVTGVGRQVAVEVDFLEGGMPLGQAG